MFIVHKDDLLILGGSKASATLYLHGFGSHCDQGFTTDFQHQGQQKCWNKMNDDGYMHLSTAYEGHKPLADGSIILGGSKA